MQMFWGPFSLGRHRGCELRALNALPLNVMVIVMSVLHTTHHLHVNQLATLAEGRCTSLRWSHPMETRATSLFTGLYPCLGSWRASLARGGGKTSICDSKSIIPKYNVHMCTCMYPYEDRKEKM